MSAILSRLIAGAAGAVLLAGCSVLQPPQLYLLPAPPKTGTPVAGLERELIGVSPMTLPGYLADGRIAVLSTDEAGGTVLTPSTGTWADDPERALTGILVRALADRTGAPVLADPWPIEALPSIRIEVAVDRMTGGTGGGALDVTGGFRVIDLRQNGLAIVRDFEMSVPIEGEGIEPLVVAHTTAVSMIADDIADALAQRFAR